MSQCKYLKDKIKDKESGRQDKIRIIRITYEISLCQCVNGHLGLSHEKKGLKSENIT